MILTVIDNIARYRIEAPDACEVKQDEKGFDYLLVPDPNDRDAPYWMFDEILIEAARDNELGLKLLSEVSLLELN